MHAGCYTSCPPYVLHVLPNERYVCLGLAVTCYFADGFPGSGNTSRYYLRRNLWRPHGSWGRICKIGVQGARFSKASCRLEKRRWRRNYSPYRPLYENTRSVRFCTNCITECPQVWVCLQFKSRKIREIWELISYPEFYWMYF